jgi:hypothetical protein
MTAVEIATTFLAAIFGDAPADTEIVVMTPPGWKPYGVAAGDPGAAARIAVAFGTDTYVNCGLHRAGAAAGRAGRGDADAVVAITAVWNDLDIMKPGAKKHYLPDRDAAHRFLVGLPIRPTVRVWSGGGYQPWWCFKEPLVLDTEADRSRARRLVWRFQAYLRLRLGGYALDATQDLARVLRVPGTVNSKYGCRVVLEDADGPRVDPIELDDLCVGVPDAERPIASGVSSIGIALDPAAEPPFGKFAALCRASLLFNRLWRREIAPKDSSQSGFDFRLAMLAADAGWTDDEIVRLLIAHRRAGGGPSKLRPDYYARTLVQARAAAGVPAGGRRRR